MSTKEQLLFALERANAEGKEISGEELAASLGVSRVAVWKAAKALQEQGFTIFAKRGGGYRLDRDCPLLAPGRIRAHLPRELLDIEIFTYDLTDSTNRQAKLYAEGGGASRALFCADAQSAGRGRLGRTFYSPAGSGLYLSCLFSSNEPLDALTAVTPYTAVAVSRILEEYTDRNIGIKWVNDLYADGKKICGILTEGITNLEHGAENKIVIGIGINLNTAFFPEELSGSAGSLQISPNRCALAARIAEAVFAFGKDPADRSFMEEYTRRSIVLGRRVRLNAWSKEYEGTVLGFDRNGGLLLDTGEDSPCLFTGGEITLRLADISDNADPDGRR